MLIWVKCPYDKCKDGYVYMIKNDKCPNTKGFGRCECGECDNGFVQVELKTICKMCKGRGEIQKEI